MRYCNNCQAMVEPVKDADTGTMVLLLIFGIIPGIIYYALKKKTCPICNGTNWGIPPSKPTVSQLPKARINYCPQCGSPVDGKFCDRCGHQLY